MVFKGTVSQNSSVFPWFVFGRASLSKTRFLSSAYLKGSCIQCLRIHRYLKYSNVFLLSGWR